RSHGQATKAPPDERGGQPICSTYSHRATLLLYAFRPFTAASSNRMTPPHRGPSRPECAYSNSAPPRGSCPGSAGGDLRIEVDGLGLPLLIKGAILSRHRQRVACLDSLQHALCLRLLRRIGRRIDELRRLQERSVGFEFEAHPRDIRICVGWPSRRLPTREIS